MWSGIYSYLSLMLQWTGYFVPMVSLVVLCWPFEQNFARITTRGTSPNRKFVIAGVALSVLLVSQTYTFFGQDAVIAFFVKLKFFSLAKLPIPDWLLIILTLLLLDFLYFLVHLMSHNVKLLWRLHKIHHTDEHVSALSGLLHHPLESIFVGLTVTAVAVMIGVPVLVYIYYTVALSIHAILSHADVALPRRLDRILRLLVVTPDVHRIHHSQNMAEGNSNFGAILTVWDRMFGTYFDQPRMAEDRLLMGLPEHEKPKAFSVKELLIFPFR